MLFSAPLNLVKHLHGSLFVELIPGTPRAACGAIPHISRSLLKHDFKQSFSPFGGFEISLIKAHSNGSTPKVVDLFGQLAVGMAEYLNQVNMLGIGLSSGIAAAQRWLPSKTVEAIYRTSHAGLLDFLLCC